MITTEQDFQDFQKAFQKWVNIFGLQEYRIVCYHEKLEDVYAHININEPGKLAEVSFNLEFIDTQKAGYVNPEYHAKHEAIHLLLHRILWIGSRRFINEQDLTEEWERLVRKLEKIL
jgi:hypothetical protein